MDLGDMESNRRRTIKCFISESKCNNSDKENNKAQQ